MESNLGKARDQDSYGRNGISWPQHMSGGSLSEMVSWKCRFVLMVLSTNDEEVGGIYSLHTKSNHYTQFTNLGGTESTNSV